MSSMTRARPAVLFLMATALLASGAAPALGAGCDLTPNGDEPNASGTARLTGLNYLGEDAVYKYYVGTLRVTSRDLTPGATYTVNVNVDVVYGGALGHFTADAKGNGTTTGQIFLRRARPFEGWNLVIVTVQRDGGAAVLLGSFFPK